MIMLYWVRAAIWVVTTWARSKHSSAQHLVSNLEYMMQIPQDLLHHHELQNHHIDSPRFMVIMESSLR
jgi:hypothetical protein